MPQPAFDWSVNFDRCISLDNHKYQRPIKRHDFLLEPWFGPWFGRSDLGSDVRI